jgi:hypothetical protein
MSAAGRIALSIAREPFAWPGGYERFAVTDDAAALCRRCCHAELSIIRQSDAGDGWHIIGAGSSADTDGPLHCDHCDAEIIPDHDQETTP